MNYTLEPFDDGHSPGASLTTTQIAVYEKQEHKQFLSVFDNLLPEVWCSKAYRYAVERSRPWGTYVTSSDAKNPLILAEEAWSAGDFQRAISLVAVRSLLYERGRGLLGSGLDAVHGTAVWCLCSGEEDSVNYHIDYAELYRYETNIIFPPLYAGTCHLSPLNCGDANKADCGESGHMVGGDFQVNVGGLQHYRRFGYKGRLSSPGAMQEDLQHSADWTTVRYRHNRGILHDGDFPHQSTQIVSITDRHGQLASHKFKRVILGFNCFTAEMAECCGRAPEHSDAFNRTIRLYQAMASSGMPVTSAPLQPAVDKYVRETAQGTAADSADGMDLPPAPALAVPRKQGLSIAAVKSNPALARMLVLAAKNIRKVRAQEEQQLQQKLEKDS